MKRLAAALSLLTLTGALVFPSAAAPFALTQSDAITQDVSIAPTTAPNGDYAYLNEDDELVVDLTASNLEVDGEGVNANGVTELADVFRVHYNGSRYAHVWITDESDAVTFVVDGEPIQSESNNVTLGPNQSVTVGIVVDTTGDARDGFIDDIDVHAKVAEPEDINGAGADALDTQRTDDTDGNPEDGGTAVQSFAPSPTERSITVVNSQREEPTTVELNTMPLDRADDAEPRANLTLDSMSLIGDGSTTLSLNLAATSSTTSDSVGVASLGAVQVTEEEDAVSAATLQFSVAQSYLDSRGIEPDELTVFRQSDGETSTVPVRVVNTESERVVFEADTPGFSTFTVAAVRQSIGVTEASLLTESITPNESATVTARVVNDGRTTGTRAVTLTLDGETVAEQTVDLEADESTAVTFAVSPDETGEFAVAVNGTTAGTLVVEAESESTPGDVNTAGGPATDRRLTATPVREPAGVGLVEVGGLALVTGVVGSLFVLTRRVSR